MLEFRALEALEVGALHLRLVALLLQGQVVVEAVPIMFLVRQVAQVALEVEVQEVQMPLELLELLIRALEVVEAL